VSLLDKETLWKETLEWLKTEIGEAEFSDWFVDLRYLGSGEGHISVGCPSVFHRDRVKKNYQGRIRERLMEIAGTEIDLKFEVNSKNGEVKASAPQKPTVDVSVETKKEPTAKVVSVEKIKREQHPDLRDDYTFEKYVIGDNNMFASNAALAISKNLGANYNPFFIYGGVGLGKTHLMQAIGNSVHENSKNKVIYVTSEDFLNEYVESVRENTRMSTFKNKFRRANLLLIDDVQFFADKPGVQEELFHTFNALLQAKNQIVFTCDRPPSELKKFETRLLNRFDQGLKVDLQPPRVEIRLAILRAAVKSRGIPIPENVLDFVSKKISSNVRDLVGALNSLIAYAELFKKEVTLEIAQKTLKDVMASAKQSNLSIETIQKVVASHFSISVNDLKGKKRSQNVVFPRQIAMHICREMTEYSSTEIGEAFGGRDHATVLYSLDKIKGRFLVDPNIEPTIENLKRQVKEMATKL